MQTGAFISFALETARIQADSNNYIVLHITNLLDVPIANLTFELSGNGVRIAGASHLTGLSIAARGALPLPAMLRGAADQASITVSGISFRTGGRSVRVPDVSLPFECTTMPDGSQAARPAARDTTIPLRASRPPALAGYFEQAVWWAQNPPSARPGLGARVFVSVAGDLQRKSRDYGVDWLEALENALKRPLADLSRKLRAAGREGEEIRPFIYSSREQGLKPGVEALSKLINIMHSAPAAILLLSHEYPAKDPTWCFEAPYLMWRHMTDGLPLFLVRATGMVTNVLRYPSPEGEEEADLRAWTCDRFGHPNILGHQDSMSLQQLKESGHLDDALLRLNGVALAVAEALEERLK